jgi:hypothetical protein
MLGVLPEPIISIFPQIVQKVKEIGGIGLFVDFFLMRI